MTSTWHAATSVLINPVLDGFNLDVPPSAIPVFFFVFGNQMIQHATSSYTANN